MNQQTLKHILSFKILKIFKVLMQCQIRQNLYLFSQCAVHLCSQCDFMKGRWMGAKNIKLIGYFYMIPTNGLAGLDSLEWEHLEWWTFIFIAAFCAFFWWYRVVAFGVMNLRCCSCHMCIFLCQTKNIRGGALNAYTSLYTVFTP